MKYVIDGTQYEVILVKKNNKNTYIRVKEDGKIYVTTNFLVSKNYIKQLLDNNYSTIKKMVERNKIKQEKNKSFYFLGKKYDIIIVPTFDIDITDDKIFVKSEDYLNKWLKKQIEKIYKERLDYIYNL